MTNAFDSSSYPTTEPAELNAGDRWAWKRSDLGEYGADYTLTYVARLDSNGTTTFTFDGAWGSGAYVVEVNPDVSAITPEVDLFLQGPAGTVLPELVNQLNKAGHSG